MFKVNAGQQLESLNSDCKYEVLEVFDDEVAVQMTHWPDGQPIDDIGSDGNIKHLSFRELAERMTPAGEEFYEMSPFKRGTLLQFTEEHQDKAEHWGNRFFVIEPFISIEEYNEEESGKDGRPTRDHSDLVRIVFNYDHDTTCKIMEGTYEGRVVFVDSRRYEVIPPKKETDDEFEEFFDEA